MFAAQLKKLRLAQKMNKAELARKSGVSDVAISYWESGQIKSITHEKLLNLASTLNVLASEIIEDPLLPQYRADLARKAIEAVSEAKGGGFAPLEAINFALTLEAPKAFLTAWQLSDWDLIRQEWPQAPDTIYPQA